MKGNKLVSIIIPNYNSENYISETLQSILEQTYTNWEAIIIDDCSTDNSVFLINKFINLDNRFRLIILNENIGKAKILNLGLKYIIGDYLAFIDSDDIWINRKLEDQLNYMSNGDYSFTFTSYFRFSDVDNYSAIAAKELVSYKMMLKYSLIGYSTVIIDSQLIREMKVPELRKRQDYALWLSLLKITNAHGIDKELTKYRIRKKSLSSNKFEMLYWNFIVYRRVENISIIKSLYYLFWDIYSKISKLK